MLRLIPTAAVVAAIALLSAAAAGAAGPERTVFFSAQDSLYSEHCQAVIDQQDEGRISVLDFYNPDGSLAREDVHQANIEEIDTNTKTGATIEIVYSSYVRVDTTVTQTASGTVATDTLLFNGLNYIYRPPSGRPVVSAGRGTQTVTLTFDSVGNLIDSSFADSATPNLVHLTDLLC